MFEIIAEKWIFSERHDKMIPASNFTLSDFSLGVDIWEERLIREVGELWIFRDKKREIKFVIYNENNDVDTIVNWESQRRVCIDFCMLQKENSKNSKRNEDSLIDYTNTIQIIVQALNVYADFYWRVRKEYVSIY